MRTIAVTTQKGGVGKTTTVANLAVAFADRGVRVLAVDLDPQFALTRLFGLDVAGASTIVNVLADGASIHTATWGILGVDLLPATRRLASVELSLTGEFRREFFLQRALEPAAGGYDVCLIDCPPNLGLLSMNALVAADDVLVPVHMEHADALHGAEEVYATVLQMGEDRPRWLGTLPVCADPRRQVYQAIREELDVSEFLWPLPVEIPDTVDFQKSAVRHVPLVAMDPLSRGADAYVALADAIAPAERGLRVVA